MAKRRSVAVKRLKTLNPQDFENLAYDLLFASGMRNLRWRTPGSDGGRDLEGEYTIADFAGDHTTQKWYVECKRYGRSLDWPTVNGKLAVAVNHEADFLLFITTSNFSTQCRDEVDRYNRKHGVQIRIWPYFYLENLLSVHGELAVKYGVAKRSKQIQADFNSIIFEAAKLAQSTYAAMQFGQDAKDRIELLAAFTELLSARAADATKFGAFVPSRFKPDRDTYAWCEPNPLPVNDFDQTSLRAALAAIRTIGMADKLKCIADGKSRFKVEGMAKISNLAASQLFALIETFGLLRCEYAKTSVTLIARSDNGKN